MGGTQVPEADGGFSVAMKVVLPDSNATGRMDWETPQWLFDQLHREFHFTIDLCATKENAKCKRFYTIEQDALRQEWRGVCWMNPPYGRGVIDKWLKKATESPNATIVCLLPSRTGPPWFHRYVLGRAFEVRFIAGKLRFVGAKSVAGFCSMLAIYRKPRSF